MDRKVVEQYVGRSVDVVLSPNVGKASGTLLRCEDDYFVVATEHGEAFYVYPMIWGVLPTSSEPSPLPEPVKEVPKAVEVPKPKPIEPEEHEPPVEPVVIEQKEEVKVQEAEPAPSAKTVDFVDEINDCYNQIKAKSETYVLNPDYVKKFNTGNQSTVQELLTKYTEAVNVKEDKPYSMRMRQLLEEAKTFWQSKKSDMGAAELYGFILHLMDEHVKSMKLYMKIRDFRAAFIASKTASARATSAACLIVSEALTPETFAAVLKLDPLKVNALLRWVMDNNPDESSFKCVCALSCKLLGFKLASLPGKASLFSQDNVDTLKEWLKTQPSDTKIVDEALNLSKTGSPSQGLEEAKEIDWKTHEFEGTFDYFNPNKDKLYGVIKCPFLKHFNVPMHSSEGSVFVHINQIEDKELRRKLVLCKNMRPMIRVTFKLGRNANGAAAYDVKEKYRKKNDDSPAPLTVNIMSALSEEGEIDFYERYHNPPYGKIWAKSDKKNYTFNEDNVTDPLLAVFLEVEPSPDSHPVRFVKGMGQGGKVQLKNIESAIPFPEDKVKAWEDSGLVKKAKQRLSLNGEDEAVMTKELEQIVSRAYAPLQPYVPEINE